MLIKKLLASVIKKYGLDEYVEDVVLIRKGDTVTSPYHLSLVSGDKAIMIGFNVKPEYKDMVDLGLDLAG